MTLNSIGSNGSLRIHTRESQPRTSSNKSFHDQLRSGFSSGITLTNSALRNVGAPIPGSAALSATLNDAARSLSGPSSVGGGGPNLNVNASEGDMGSLQNEMLRNNQDMLEQQVQVSRITTEYSTRSYILKAMFDSLKTIGSNIR